jgi:hypothetical protein
MRVCADCQNQIHKTDKWKIDGSRIRHVNCRNPRLIEALLPLWQTRDPLKVEKSVATQEQPKQLEASHEAY